MESTMESTIEKVKAKEGRNWKSKVRMWWLFSKYPDYLSGYDKANLQTIRNTTGKL